jgi:hypothetical protein
MALFLTISEDRAGGHPHPILSTADARIIAAALTAIQRRMTPPLPAISLRPVRARRGAAPREAEDGKASR